MKQFKWITFIMKSVQERLQFVQSFISLSIRTRGDFCSRHVSTHERTPLWIDNSLSNIIVACEYLNKVTEDVRNEYLPVVWLEYCCWLFCWEWWEHPLCWVTPSLIGNRCINMKMHHSLSHRMHTTTWCSIFRDPDNAIHGFTWFVQRDTFQQSTWGLIFS